MRMPVSRCVGEIQIPSQRDRDDAAVAGRSAGAEFAHEYFLREWGALTTIELVQPAMAARSTTLSIGAWNLERCKKVEETAELVAGHQLQILLATEMDYGMARSGQRHTTRDLAKCLGMGYIFGVEFVELGIGDFVESRIFLGQENACGLHGNAIISSLQMKNPRLIPLDDGGLWYLKSPKNDNQLRVGGRMAIVAQVELLQKDVTIASVHFESESDPEGRASQTRRLLSSLDEIYGTGPCIIGGDFNTVALTGLSSSLALSGHSNEPCFNVFREFGFDWRGANTGLATNRAPVGKDVRYPLMRLDWFFYRGVKVESPKTTAALSDRLEYLSDHELISAVFSAY